MKDRKTKIQKPHLHCYNVAHQNSFIRHPSFFKWVHILLDFFKMHISVLSVCLVVLVFIEHLMIGYQTQEGLLTFQVNSSVHQSVHSECTFSHSNVPLLTGKTSQRHQGQVVLIRNLHTFPHLPPSPNLREGGRQISLCRLQPPRGCVVSSLTPDICC